MSDDKNKSNLITFYIFSESKTLALDVEGNKYRLYLLDASTGMVGMEKFSITSLPKAIDSFNIRKNCIRPELKSSYIKRIRGYDGHKGFSWK